MEKDRQKSIEFLQNNLKLCVKANNEVIIKARWGLKFLGMMIYPDGRKLNKRNIAKINKELSRKNISSYAGLVKKHQNQKEINRLNWKIMEMLYE